MSAENTQKEELDDGKASSGRKKTRINLIQEILDTEKDFFNDVKSCVDIFLTPSDVNKFECEGIKSSRLFLNLKEVYELSQKLLKLLDKHVAAFDFHEQTVGLCFLEISEELESVYLYYCLNIDAACQYANTVSHWPVIVDKVKILNKHYKNTNKIANLNSMLMKPVQRITKYPLLLQSLLDVTEEAHADMGGLFRATACIKTAMNNINEGKRVEEIITKYRRPSDVNLFNKISSRSVHKKITRFKGFVASKTGTAPLMQDAEFNHSLHKFDSIQQTVSNLIKNFEVFIYIFKESCLSFCDVVNDFVTVFGNEERTAPFIPYLRQLSHTFSSDCESLTSQLQSSLVSPLTELMKLYEGPKALICKRHDKLMEIYGDISSKSVQKEYDAITRRLKENLPLLYKTSVEIVMEVINNFILLKNSYQNIFLSNLQKVDGVFGCHRVLQSQATPPPPQQSGIDTDLLSISDVFSFPGNSELISPVMDDNNNDDDVDADDDGDNDEDGDDGFYFAKTGYCAARDQPEVSLEVGQFVTVISKKDGNGNCYWWQVYTDGKIGYCPGNRLEKAIDFMETGELPFADIKENPD
ncbi:rho guanine nucleotide exchange factor 38-like isoform X2 [Argonauta hians]